MKEGEHIPLDSEPGNPRLLRQNVPTNLFNHRLARRALCQCLIRILIINIIPHTHKLASIIAASQKNDSNTNDFRARDIRSIRWIGFEDEFVCSRRNGPDKEGIEFLVMFGAR